MEIAVSGRKEQADTAKSLTELVNTFITYAQDQMADEMGTSRWPNLVESPLRDGYRGSDWTQAVQPTISYYRGGRESLPDGKERSRMSLQGRADTWEERLPAHLRVSASQVQDVLDAGGAGPPGRVHQYVNHRQPTHADAGPWREGGGGNGYNQINHAGLREDPITRLFLRHQAFEQGGATVRTHTGRQITCGEVNKAALYEDADAMGSGQTQGDAESLRALVDVCLPVHYSVHFTHAAAVDGSMDDPRQRGGEGASG
jgi:hypothetical protein